MKTRKNKSFIFIIIAILAAIIVFIYLTKDSFIYKKFRSNINISEQDLDIVYGADSVDLTIYMFSNYN
ncbi:MAG: hypothetical protein U9R54_02225, partial [Bacteroidota bacterium]|nr:hypothetical protein [Bacteroidota bacterium]